MASSVLQLRPDRSSLSTDVDKKRLKICHVSMTLLTGGLERLLVEIARHCDSHEFELHFVALDGVGQPAADIELLGWPVTSLNAKGSLSKRQRLKTLTELLRREQFDVVHSHNTLAHFYATAAAKWAGVPVVINTQHGRGCGASWKARLQFRLANLKTDRIVGVSHDATELCRRDDPFAKSRMQVIWNGIDVKRFAFSGPSRKPVAISVARLSPEKDFGTLLRATQLVVRDYPDFRLRIVGDGRERGSLETLRQQLGLEAHVEFLGERHDVPQLLAQAGFFVSSSKSEGISLTLLEAMAIGLPIVATSVGGNPEIVLDGQTGRLVPSESPEQLAAAMQEMLADRSLWNSYGTLGRKRVEEQFNITHMVSQYEQLYRELIAEKRAERNVAFRSTKGSTQ